MILLCRQHRGSVVETRLRFVTARQLQRFFIAESRQILHVVGFVHLEIFKVLSVQQGQKCNVDNNSILTHIYARQFFFVFLFFCFVQI